MRYIKTCSAPNVRSQHFNIVIYGVFHRPHGARTADAIRDMRWEHHLRDWVYKAGHISLCTLPNEMMLTSARFTLIDNHRIDVSGTKDVRALRDGQRSILLHFPRIHRYYRILNGVFGRHARRARSQVTRGCACLDGCCL